MKEYAVNGDVLQKILTYLASRPYAEVFELVKGIQNTSRELPEPVKASGPTDVASSGTGVAASA